MTPVITNQKIEFKECIEATPLEYQPLLNELIGQGYDDLQILNK